METNKITTKSLVLIAMFAAVLAVLSQISIPMPSGVPVTLQTFGVALCAAVLGWKLGTAAVAIYLLLGAVGIPVYASFSVGLGTLVGATGGFLFGFLPMAALTGLFNPVKNKIAASICSAAGLLLCHLLGILQFMFLMKQSFLEAAVLVSLPYLLKDVVSVVLAFAVGLAIKRTLNAAGILSYV